MSNFILYGHFYHSSLIHSFIGNEQYEMKLFPEVKIPFASLESFVESSYVSYFASKMMGYLIVFGSSIMKFPQIMNILKSRSVTGLNIYSFYFECAENLPIIIYNAIYVDWSTKGLFIEIPIQYIRRVYSYFNSRCYPCSFISSVLLSIKSIFLDIPRILLLLSAWWFEILCCYACVLLGYV